MRKLPVVIVSAAPYPQPAAYSVWHVIRAQADAVASLGREVRVVAPAERAVETKWQSGAQLTTTAGDLSTLARRLRDELPGEVLLLTHDLVTSAAGIDLVERVSAGHPRRRWAHWIHGQLQDPGIDWSVRYPLPNAWFVGQVDAQLEALARIFRVPRERVRSIANQRSVAEYLGLGPIAQTLAAACDWLSCTVRAVYPARRSGNKDWPALLTLLVAMAESGERVGLIGLDTPAGAEDELPAIREHRARAEDAGVRIALASDLAFPAGVPQPTVRELLGAGNLLVLPSVEETFSLVTAEAMLTKNLVVLDQSCAGAREVAGDTALHLDFARVKSDGAYRREAARAVCADLAHNRVLAGQQRIFGRFDSSHAGRQYAELLDDMERAETTTVDQLLSHPELAQPFRALAYALADGSPPPPAPGASGPLDVEAALDVALDHLRELSGEDRCALVREAFALLVRYERAIRGTIGRPSPVDDDHADRGLARDVTLLPLSPVLQRYAAHGHVARDRSELDGLLAERESEKALLLLRAEQDGVARAVVDGDSASALSRWLGGGRVDDSSIERLREAGFLS